MRHKWIVTADDCGLSEGINLAAIDLHRQGIVTHVSVMSNFPSTPHALESLSRNPQLKTGVHLNLTDGFALLRPNQPLPSLVTLLARSWDDSFRKWIEAELDVQIQVLIRAGIQPDHLTTHLQFHVLPQLRRIVERLAQKYNVVWVRPYRLHSIIAPFNPFLRYGEVSTDDKPAYLAVLKHWMRTSPEILVQTLERFDGYVELVVHPCLASDETFPKYLGYGVEERFRESEYLHELMKLD